MWHDQSSFITHTKANAVLDNYPCVSPTLRGWGCSYPHQYKHHVWSQWQTKSRKVVLYQLTVHPKGIHVFSTHISLAKTGYIATQFKKKRRALLSTWKFKKRVISEHQILQSQSLGNSTAHCSTSLFGSTSRWSTFPYCDSFNTP